MWLLQKTALIVDDDQSVLRNFSRLLRENGYDVQAIETGGEALGLVDRQSFDIVLIDFKLPDIDGAELLEKIRGKISKAIKIMITGFPTTDLENKVIDLGIDAYVVKPIKPDELLELIQKLTKNKPILDLIYLIYHNCTNQFFTYILLLIYIYFIALVH